MNKTWTIIVGALGAVCMVLLVGFGEHVIGQLDDQSKDISQIKVDIATIKTQLGIRSSDLGVTGVHTNQNYVLVNESFKP